MISLVAVATTPLFHLAGTQIAVALLSAVTAFVLYGTTAAKAVLAGSAVALTNALLLAWQMRADEGAAHQDAHRHLRTFYRASQERFFVVGLLLAAALGPLGVKPFPLLAGFVIGQLALMASLFIRKTK